MDFIVLDKDSNNVLGEFDTFEEADAYRIQTVGFNADLAEHVVVIDLDRLVETHRAVRNEASALA